MNGLNAFLEQAVGEIIAVLPADGAPLGIDVQSGGGNSDDNGADVMPSNLFDQGLFAPGLGDDHGDDHGLGDDHGVDVGHPIEPMDE